MQRHSIVPLAIAAALCASGQNAFAMDTTSSSCISSADPDSRLDRVPDCMRMGRHVRVESSVSRGTATLTDGVTPTTLQRDPSQDGVVSGRRVRVPDGPFSSLWSGFFTRQ